MGSFSNRTGTPVDNGVFIKNTHKIVEETRVQNILRAFMSSNDVPVLLLNQPNKKRKRKETGQQEKNKKITALSNVPNLFSRSNIQL